MTARLISRIIAFFFLISVLPVHAQFGNFRNYTVADGLPQSYIYSLYNDSRGFIWIGSETGVCSFDGKHYINYSRKNGLNGNNIRAISEDIFGRLWFGSENGITIFNGIDFFSLDSTKGLNSPIMSICKGQNNTFWVGTSGGGAYIIQNAVNPDSVKVTSIVLPDKLGSKHIFSICSDGKDNMLLGSFGGGIFVVDEHNLSLKKNLTKPEIPSEHILCIKSTSTDKIWVGTYGSGTFSVLPSQNWKNELISSPKELDGEVVWDIFPKEKNTWFATDKNGVWRSNSGVWTHFDQNNGLQANQVFKIIDDQEGNIWLALFGNGLSMFLGDHFEHYGPQNGISNKILGIQPDPSGDIWLATADKGLLKMSTHTKTPKIKEYNNYLNWGESNVTALALDVNGKLWFNNSRNGLVCFNGKSYTYFTSDNGLINNEVNSILADRNGKIWIGTIGGLSIFDKGRFFNIDAKSFGLPNNEIQTIIENPNGDIWVGTLNGLVKFTGNQMTSYDDTDGLHDKQISALTNGNKNSVWIGTTAGLYLYRKSGNKKQIEKFADENQLASANITGLLQLNHKTLIVATDKGFEKIYLNDSLQIIRIKHFDKMNGFVGIENNYRALAADKAGNIWFGTVKGLTKYCPQKEIEYTKPPKLVLSSIKLFHEKISPPDNNSFNASWTDIPHNLTFKYSENHISFQFVGISYSDPTKVRYRYKLDGLETQWSPALNIEEVVYSGLKPGNYKFQIKAQGSNGLWLDSPITYSFEIKPPFWQKIWFIALVIFLSVLIILSYMRYRERKLRNDKIALEKVVVERTIEVVKQKVILEEQKKEITDSINYASLIQIALLPADKHLNSLLADYFIVFKPRDVVSGDFYWCAEKDNKMLLVVADCTGHGVPGAFMSMLGISFLNETVLDKNITDPAEILNAIRCKIIQVLQQVVDGPGRKDGMDMTVVCYEPKNDYLLFAGANLPLYKVTGNVLETFKGDKMPVGVHVRNDLFKNIQVPIAPNDIFYLSTDGYGDQFGGEMNKKFLVSRLKEMFEENNQKAMKEQHSIFSNRIEEWMKEGNCSQTDDITLMGFRIK